MRNSGVMSTRFSCRASLIAWAQICIFRKVLSRKACLSCSPSAESRAGLSGTCSLHRTASAGSTSCCRATVTSCEKLLAAMHWAIAPWSWPPRTRHRVRKMAQYVGVLVAGSVRGLMHLLPVQGHKFIDIGISGGHGHRPACFSRRGTLAAHTTILKTVTLHQVLLIDVSQVYEHITLHE